MLAVKVMTPAGVTCDFGARAVTEPSYEFVAEFRVPWDVVGKQNVDYATEMKNALGMAIEKYIEQMKNRSKKP